MYKINLIQRIRDVSNTVTIQYRIMTQRHDEFEIFKNSCVKKKKNRIPYIRITKCKKGAHMSTFYTFSAETKDSKISGKKLKLFTSCINYNDLSDSEKVL